MGEDALVGHHRRVDACGDEGEPVEVGGLDRLLQQPQRDAAIFQRTHGAHRLFGRPALIGIQPQRCAPSDCGMNCRDAFDIRLDVLADLDLQCAIAVRERRLRLRHHGVDGIGADGDVGRDARRAATEQLVQRRTKTLRPQIVQCDFHRGLGAGVAFERVLNEPA